jgi:uncharacterized membrane protein
MANRDDVRDNAGREDVRANGVAQRAGSSSGTSAHARNRGSANGSTNGDERLATGLGWFSIGLGLAQIVAPGSVARLIGVNDDTKNRGLMRAIGMREIATGVGILSRPRPANWVRARVGGDLIDLTLLGAAIRSADTEKGKVAMATAAVLGVTALDVMCSERLGEKASGKPAGRAREGAKTHVAKAITIRTTPDQLYSYWRELSNLPRFMYHLEEVRVINERRSHWVAKAPAGAHVEWDAEITEDRPNERIAWRSLPDADVRSSGSVEFRPAPRGRGTEVHVELHYDPPGGKLGVIVAKLMGEEPARQIGDDLRRLKQVIETGEVVRSDATVVGQGPGLIRQRPAQPPRREEITQALREARL